MDPKTTSVFQYWLEVGWPEVDGSPHKELYIWFNEKEVNQVKKYHTGDRVAFYVTQRNPAPGPAGGMVLFATGTVTPFPIETIDESYGGKRYVRRRKVDVDIYPSKEHWIPLVKINTLTGYKPNHCFRQGQKLKKKQFDALETELQYRSG